MKTRIKDIPDELVAAIMQNLGDGKQLPGDDCILKTQLTLREQIMQITFKREPDLEDDDIARAWFGVINKQRIALAIFEWSAAYRSVARVRFSISYNEKDQFLALFIGYITSIADAHLKEHGHADALVIDLPEVTNEAA